MDASQKVFKALRLLSNGKTASFAAKQSGLSERRCREYSTALKRGQVKLTSNGYINCAGTRIACQDIKAQKLKAGGEVEKTGSEKALEVVVKSPKRIRTVQEALRKAEVDMTTWMVDRFVINSWEVGAKHPDTGQIIVEPLWQVKIWLKPRTGSTVAEFRDQLIKDMQQHRPRYEPVRRRTVRTNRRLMFEIAPVDHHFGKLSWHEESGDNYDLKIADRVWDESYRHLLECVEGFPVERYLVVLGNDMLHIDNQASTTTSGTNLDTDGRRQKMLRYARLAAVRMIEDLRTRAPVSAIIVPGNHDENTMFQLGETLYGWFHNCPDVDIVNNAFPRKYVQFGKVGLGFAHGHIEKQGDLPLLMADEQKQMWADTTFREFHIGHFHTRRQMTWMKTDSFGLTTVRTLPALCGSDAWHARHGLRSIRMSEGYLWDYDRGLGGIFCTSPEGQD